MLITEKLNDTGKERIRTLVDSQDGFAIAEMDLKLRGPGEFFGTKQSGLPSLKIANILRDPDILSAARHEARAFVEHPPSHEAFVGGGRVHQEPLAEAVRSGAGGLTMRVIGGRVPVAEAAVDAGHGCAADAGQDAGDAVQYPQTRRSKARCSWMPMRARARWGSRR